MVKKSKKVNASGYSIVKRELKKLEKKFTDLNRDYDNYKNTVKKVVPADMYQIIVEVLREERRSKLCKKS